MATIARNVRTTLEMIKIEHTLFALPFAFLGAVLAARGLPSASQIIWITLAMIGARSTAMAFNRIADKDFDARNPRTKMRAIPAGILSVGFAMAFTMISARVCIRFPRESASLARYGYRAPCTRARLQRWLRYTS